MHRQKRLRDRYYYNNRSCHANHKHISTFQTLNVLILFTFLIFGLTILVLFSVRISLTLIEFSMYQPQVVCLIARGKRLT